MDRIVLCIQVAMLIAKGLVPELGKRFIKPFHMEWIRESDLCFLHRRIADSTEILQFATAIQTPQILPYMLVKHGDSYLTYSRSKGTEKRLHGTRSIGFGGHIDVVDVGPGADAIDVILASAARELKEELGLAFDDFEDRVVFNHCIVDYMNNVGMVHFALIAVIELEEEDLADMQQCTEELEDVKWIHKSQLVHDAELYENWSKALILSEGEFNFN